MGLVEPRGVEQLSLTEYRAHARAWLKKNPAPDVPHDLEGRFSTLREWQARLYSAGFVGIHWPERFGGQGLSVRHNVVFLEELITAEGPLPIGNIGLDVVGPSIIEFGDDGQRADLVPRMLSGEDIWCQGFSEPEAGSDLASLRTTATLVDGQYRIDGYKVWTTWGNFANRCAVLARSDSSVPKHAGISYFLIDMDSPGITAKPLRQINGDAEFSEVEFDGVMVDASRVLGAPGDGWKIAMHTLGNERGGYALRRRAELDVLLVRVLRTIAESGRTVSEHQLANLGRAAMLVRTLEAQTRRTLGRLEASEVSPVDSMDKLLLTEAEQAVGAAVFDLLGPLRLATGADTDLDVEALLHAYLSSRAVSIYGGTAQIQRDIVAKRQLGLRQESRS